MGFFISVLSLSVDVVFVIGLCVMVFNIMFGDVFGVFVEIFDFLVLFFKFSFIRYVFEGVLCLEFEGLVFEKEDIDVKSKKFVKFCGV